jgi:hypothetical protein
VIWDAVTRNAGDAALSKARNIRSRYRTRSKSLSSLPFGQRALCRREETTTPPGRHSETLHPCEAANCAKEPPAAGAKRRLTTRGD